MKYRIEIDVPSKFTQPVMTSIMNWMKRVEAGYGVRFISMKHLGE